MTHVPTPIFVDRLPQRQRLALKLYQALGILSVLLFVATGTWAILNNQRVDNLRATLHQARADAVTATKIAADEQAAQVDQYNQLFAACKKSTACLASAPSLQSPIVVQGAPGANGRSVTADDVQAAIGGYCLTRNSCAGAVGASGAAGQPGANGATGAAGSNGVDGRSVAGITCVALSTPPATALEFTMTDGSKIDVNASCNLS